MTEAQVFFHIVFPQALRYIADECGFAVLLVGTELYERQFANARTKPLLLQLGRRIGAKPRRRPALSVSLMQGRRRSLCCRAEAGERVLEHGRPEAV